VAAKSAARQKPPAEAGAASAKPAPRKPASKA
jgi:hypothetical protein